MLRFISDNVFIKGEGVSHPTSVSSISIQCMVDEIRLTVLTTWKLIRKDPWMSESLENDRRRLFISYQLGWQQTTNNRKFYGVS